MMAAASVACAGPTQPAATTPEREWTPPDATHLAQLQASVDVVLGTGGPLPLVEGDAHDPAITGTGLAAVTVSAQGADPARIIVDPSVARQMPRDALDIVLAHEMVHVREQPSTSSLTPTWVVEGFADLIAYQVTGADTSALQDLAMSQGPPTGLPTAGDFAAGGEPRDVAYARAWSVWSYLVSLIGMPAAVPLYRAMSLTGEATSIEDALESTIGQSMPGFVAGWIQALQEDS